jgi:amino acid adenylation domain-containing protein
MSAEVVTLGPTVVALIDQTAASSPESLAVRGSDGTLTYSELLARSERIAARLRQIGIMPGDLVGLCLERSTSLVVGALAIFLAEGVYVAIDPKYPDERIRWMLDDSNSAAVVCDGAIAERIGTGGDRAKVILQGGGTLDDWSIPDARDVPRNLPEPLDLAYVVYTSGSTGQPKGVMVEHAGLTNLIEWHRSAFALGPNDRCTQIASPGFDAAVWEIWPTLAVGASLHVVPDALRNDPIGLRDWLVAEGITVTFLPTAVAEGIIGLPWPQHAALRFLLTGGDALTRRPPTGLGFTLVNNYGLSETAVVATSGSVDPAGEGPPTIGGAIRGVVAEVLDEQLRPVERGAIGELVIGGVAVARGYLDRPELTAERFVDGRGGKRYRTGDLVRLRPDGEFDFLGRIDDQLSIRGFRVEPAEIISAMNSHPAIRASATLAVGGSSADRQLVGYLVSSGTDHPNRDELADFLGESLPEYLVPTRFVWLDELPLTAHGKIDREALAALDRDATDASVDEIRELPGDEPPRTPIQTAIASVLVELLGIPAIGLNENFFLLGGHSMLGAQLIVRLENLFDVEITLRYLFDHPTLAEIAVGVENQAAADAADGARTG